MTDEKLAETLADALNALKATTAESKATRDMIPGLVVDRHDWQTGQRRLTFGLVLLAVGLIACLVVLLPLAGRNSTNLAKSTETLALLERVTGPASRAQSDAQVGALICALAADHHALHASAPPAALELVVPVLDDKGKPTGAAQAVSVPCPTATPATAP